jgi:hypothetical protein
MKCPLWVGRYIPMKRLLSAALLASLVSGWQAGLSALERPASIGHLRQVDTLKISR